MVASFVGAPARREEFGYSYVAWLLLLFVDSAKFLI
jgi:hypothetical protein